MMLLKNKKTAILGAGPVGLTMARLLQQEGIDVTVYERDKDAEARIWGATLDLHKESGQKAMDKAGLLDRYYELAIAMGRTIADEQAKVLFVKEPAYDNPEINRNNLRTMLLQSLANDTVVWDRKCTGLKADNGKWRLQFQNGMDAAADIVIEANGGMSKVRNYVTDTEVEDTGTYIVQCEVSEPEINCAEFYKLCNGNIFMMSDRGNSLVANPVNNGVLTYNIFFKTPRDWAYKTALNFQDTDSLIAFLLHRFPHWHKAYQQLFRATSSFWGLPTRKLPLDTLWKQDRPLPITLIGDAAHLMPPFAGQGVNTGLTDALVLAENLTSGNFKTVAEAIYNYEQKMKVYAGDAQLESGKNEIELHDPHFTFRNFFQ